jgi:tRNA A37 threonylcarbamoyladenosine synthetase subunit TsaC/SUA5/YrdC
MQPLQAVRRVRRHKKHPASNILTSYIKKYQDIDKYKSSIKVKAKAVSPQGFQSEF